MPRRGEVEPELSPAASRARGRGRSWPSPLGGPAASARGSRVPPKAASLQAVAAAGRCGHPVGVGLRGRAGIGSGCPWGPPGRGLSRRGPEGRSPAEAVARAAARLNRAKSTSQRSARSPATPAGTSPPTGWSPPRRSPMADSTRDPLVHGHTVGSRGGWVASAWPGLGSASFPQDKPPGGQPASSLSQRRPLSPVFQENPALLSRTHQLSLIPALPPTSSTSQASQSLSTSHFLLTAYNGGHSLADAGTIMQLRIKQSGLQKTYKGQASSPAHRYGHSQRLDRA